MRFVLSVLLNTLILALVANGFAWMSLYPVSIYFLVAAFVLANVFAGTWIWHISNKRVAVCQHGTVLLFAFYLSVLVSVVYQIIFAVITVPTDYRKFLWNLAVCFGVHFVVFWNGILCVYLTSAQLGLKLRVAGIVCGMIPIVNLIVLFFILKKSTEECLLEHRKVEINKQRKAQKVCATTYPLLMVHGVFFRDTKYFNYWGRIPRELEANGAVIYYGEHSSAASVADCAAELQVRIEEVLAQTGAEKVNIIAHSKGGLDARYAIAKLGIGDRVASLTTINTPHHGCLYADYLLTKIPKSMQNRVAKTYNSALKRLGEETPDFFAAVGDLTDAYCRRLNAECPTPEGVFCQSVGSVLTRATHGKFPLNFSYYLVKHFGGANDGLVSETSFAWGEKYTLLKSPKKRGISHGDVIDLNRENISGFDVREFYVGLVNDLKERGL